MNMEKKHDNPITPELLKRSNTAMLIIIGINFLAAFISLVSDALVLVVAVATIGIIFDDYKTWEKAGVQMCSRWWSLIFPVYLWKRANILGISKQLFWLWLGAFGAIIFIFIVIAIFLASNM